MRTRTPRSADRLSPEAGSENWRVPASRPLCPPARTRSQTRTMCVHTLWTSSLSASLSVCLLLCFPVCLSICMPVYLPYLLLCFLPVYLLSACLPVFLSAIFKSACLPVSSLVCPTCDSRFHLSPSSCQCSENHGVPYFPVSGLLPPCPLSLRLHHTLDLTGKVQ